MPILALPRHACAHLLQSPITAWDTEFTPPEFQQFSWHDRPTIEPDPTWQQIIPYAVLIDLTDRPWAYRRSGGDGRLRERRSIGVGGHVEAEDDRGTLLPTIQAALARELTEELVEIPSIMVGLARPLAWINEQDSAIGRVHLGLVFVIPWGLTQPPRPRPEEGLDGIGFVDPVTVTETNGYEAWSVLALSALRTLP